MNIYDLRNDKIALVAELRRIKDQIIVPSDITDSDYIDSYTWGRALDKFLIHYFNDPERKYSSNVDLQRGIDGIFDECFKELMPALIAIKEKFRRNVLNPRYRCTNLFEAAATENLYLSNQYTRIITENLGHKFEHIASLSRNAFNHEDMLGINIRGVDVIIFDGKNIRYTQIKTKRDTLTGSQVPRSNRELSIHPNSIFAAALDLGVWTFNNRKDNLNVVTRLAGSDFWNLIGIDYNYILQKSVEFIRKIELGLYSN